MSKNTYYENPYDVLGIIKSTTGSKTEGTDGKTIKDIAGMY
jgi:hypothetical protein